MKLGHKHIVGNHHQHFCRSFVDFVWHHHKGILTLERNPGGEESLEEQVSSSQTRKKVTLPPDTSNFSVIVFVREP